MNLRPPSLASMDDGESSGEALIARIEDHARVTSAPLSDWDSWALRHSVLQLIEGSAAREPEEATRQRFVELNNRVVGIVRAAIAHDKQFDDTFCIQAARGLRVPAFWELHYEVIYSSNLPWAVSAIMQNVFLGNPFAGERKPWKSP